MSDEPDRWEHLSIEQLRGADYALRLVYSSPVVRGRALEIVQVLQLQAVETANRKLTEKAANDVLDGVW